MDELQYSSFAFRCQIHFGNIDISTEPCRTYENPHYLAIDTIETNRGVTLQRIAERVDNVHQIRGVGGPFPKYIDFKRALDVCLTFGGRLSTNWEPIGNVFIKFS